MTALAAVQLARELDKLTPAQKREHARSLILAFCREKRRLHGDLRHYSLKQLRGHFDNLKMIEVERKLCVQFRELIDGMIRAGEVRVTNGIVWVP